MALTPIVFTAGSTATRLWDRLTLPEGVLLDANSSEGEGPIEIK